METKWWFHKYKYKKVLYCYIIFERRREKMNEDKIKNMLSQLIKMVGNIQSEQQEMKQVQQDMQGRKEEKRGRMVNYRIWMVDYKVWKANCKK